MECSSGTSWRGRCGVIFIAGLTSGDVACAMGGVHGTVSISSSIAGIGGDRREAMYTGSSRMITIAIVIVVTII